MTKTMVDILFALSITLLIEPIIASSFFKMEKKVFIVSFISNLILNPAMNLILMQLGNEHYYLYLAIFEVATFLLESSLLIFLAKKPVIKSLLAALVANLASFGLGFLLNQIGISYQVELILTVTLLSIEVIALGVYLALAFLDVANKKHHSNDRAG